MANNPFEGVSFSQAAEEMERNGIGELPGYSDEQSDEGTDPFAGMKFSEVANSYENESKMEMSDTMQMLSGQLPESLMGKEEVDNLFTKGLSVTESLDEKKAEADQEKRQQEKEARTELGGVTEGGFVSGREQIPFNVNDRKEELRKQIEEGNTDLRHKIKLMGETFALSTADFVDFIREAPKTLNFMNLFGDAAQPLPDYMEINGEKVELGPNFRQATEEILKDTYEVLGMDPEFEKVENGTDIPLMLLSQNLSGSTLMAGGKTVVDLASGVTPKLAKFMKQEFTVSLAGAGTGTTAAAFSGGSPEDRENIAQVGNMVGVFGLPLVASLPTIQIARQTYKQVAKAKGFMDSDNAYTMAQERVHRYLASFVPETEIPAINQRMELVRRIQRREPDFKPTVGNVIGTEETRLIQRITDAKNHKKATDQYLKTKAAVDRMSKRLTDPAIDPTEKAEIAAALRMFADDATTHVQRLSDRINILEAEGRRVRRGDTGGSEAGKNIRGELNTLKKSYEEAMNFVYANVDPEGLAKFDARNLISRVRGISKDTSDLDLVLDEQDTGYNFVSNILPKYITKLSKRDGSVAEMAEEAGLVLPAGFVQKAGTKETPYLTFEELHKLKSNVQKRAAKIRRKDPSSNAPAVLNKIADDLNDMMDNRMLSGDPAVKDRYMKATQFAREEFYNRFRSGVGEKLLREDDVTGDYFVKADDVGSMFWRTGPKETNIEEFNKLFNVDNLKLSGKVPKDTDPDKLKEMADAASDIARENLKAYAMRTLQDDLDKAPTKDAVAVLEAWKTKYKGVLSTFDDISKNVDEVGEQLTRFEYELGTRTKTINKLNKEIIENYGGVQESTVLDNIFNNQISVEDTSKFVDDIYVAAARNSGQKLELNAETSDAFALLYPDIQRVDKTSKEIIQMQSSLRNSVVAELVQKAYDPKIQGPSWSKMDKMLVGDARLRSKLENILGEEGMQSLDDFSKALRLMGTENKPISLKELNEVKDFMNKLGFSPASVLSRYYSHALGKVGPGYLAIDALTRLFTGVSQKHFDKVYRETMYDLDGLQAVLKNMGEENHAELVARTKEALKKQGVAGLKAMSKTALQTFFNEHMIVTYGRGADFYAELETMREERDRATATNNLMEWYLEMNDPLTQQPSRVRNSLYDRDTLTEEDDDFTEFEKEIKDDTSNPIEYYNQNFLFNGNLFPGVSERQFETSKEFQKKGEGTMTTPQDAVEDLYSNLAEEEGAFGDTTGAAVTGELGVTSGARSAVEGSENMSDTQIAKAYIQKLNENIPDNTPYSVRYSLLDTAYNLGEGMFKYKNLSKNLSEGDWMGVANSLLNTASIGGESSKGIAGRRARAYNRIAKEFGGDIIQSVFQSEDGTLSYLGEEDKVIFSYRPKGGRHESSKVGMIRIEKPQMVATSNSTEA